MDIVHIWCCMKCRALFPVMIWIGRLRHWVERTISRQHINQTTHPHMSNRLSYKTCSYFISLSQDSGLFTTWHCLEMENSRSHRPRLGNTKKTTSTEVLLSKTNYIWSRSHSFHLFLKSLWYDHPMPLLLKNFDWQWLQLAHNQITILI